ncbi:MAG: alpha-D-ribose 1-methylphosphonate 5-triphosphate diphosphatase, partial [Pseudonocardia sp.]
MLGHVRAVLPDRVLDDARIVVRDGSIAEVGPHPGGAGCDVDGTATVCLPGLVDVHTDGLELERMPRPGVPLPWDQAVASFEGKLRAAGVTTAFHGAAFGTSGSPTGTRSTEAGLALCAAVRERGDAGAVDHRVLHRLDVRCPDGLAALQDLLAATPGPALVSHEDHTPGQGQYADRAYYERYLQFKRGLDENGARREVDEIVADRDSRLAVRDRATEWLARRARRGAVRLVGHDPVSAAEIDALVARGGAVAEFPTTVEAARAARDRGLPVVMGAPNVLRGGSHSGNVSATELAARGLATALASDYLPAALLSSVFLLAGRGVLGLPAAAALVTSGAATAAGLTDRGALVVGRRADLVLVDTSGPWPVAGGGHPPPPRPRAPGGRRRPPPSPAP